MWVFINEIVDEINHLADHGGIPERRWDLGCDCFAEDTERGLLTGEFDDHPLNICIPEQGIPPDLLEEYCIRGQTSGLGGVQL